MTIRKKLSMAALGVATVVLTNVVGLSPDQAKTITDGVVIIVGLFVSAQAAVDFRSGSKGS